MPTQPSSNQTVRTEFWLLTDKQFAKFCPLHPHNRHIVPLAHLFLDCDPKMIDLFWQEEERDGQLPLEFDFFNPFFFDSKSHTCLM